MIVYKDILNRLSSNGWSIYRLVREHELGNGTIARIRSGQSISTETLNVICRLCECQPGDLLAYEPDTDQKER